MRHPYFVLLPMSTRVMANAVGWRAQPGGLTWSTARTAVSLGWLQLPDAPGTGTGYFDICRDAPADFLAAAEAFRDASCLLCSGFDMPLPTGASSL